MTMVVCSRTNLVLLLVALIQTSLTRGFTIIQPRHANANVPFVRRTITCTSTPCSRIRYGYVCTTNTNINTRTRSMRHMAHEESTGVASSSNNENTSAGTDTGVTLNSLREMLQQLRTDLTKEIEDKEEEQKQQQKQKPGKDPNSLKIDIDIDIDTRNLSPDAKARELILSTRIDKLESMGLNCTRLGQSTISGAGRGLFATRDIPKGELVTCYPGDALLYLPEVPEDEDEDDYVDVDEIVIWGTHVDEKDRWDEDAVFDGYDNDGNDVKDENVNDDSDSIEQHHNKGRTRPLVDYALYVCDMYSVLGNPLLDSNPAYSGHFANDYGGHHAIGGLRADVGNDNDNGIGNSSSSIEESIVAYVDESIKMANAQNSVLEDSHMVTIATRDISEGDEIFVTYGMNYWMEYDSHSF